MKISLARIEIFRTEMSYSWEENWEEFGFSFNFLKTFWDTTWKNLHVWEIFEITRKAPNYYKWKNWSRNKFFLLFSLKFPSDSAMCWCCRVATQKKDAWVCFRKLFWIEVFHSFILRSFSWSVRFCVILKFFLDTVGKRRRKKRKARTFVLTKPVKLC